MIKASEENVFIGSVVEKKGERYNVYKVNKNFVWAGKRPSFVITNEWGAKEKGTTWATIMEKYEGVKLIFSNLMVDETATNEVVHKKNLSKKKYLSLRA